MKAEFTDRVALVTGGSRGIGRATALQLARGGADVAISYATRVGPAEETIADIQALGRKAIAIPCDVSQPEQVEMMASTTREQLGSISLMAHCGAISNTAAHGEMTYELFKETIDVNLNGTYRMVRRILPGMIERGGGYFLQMASAAGLLNQIGDAAYSTTKHAAVGFAEALAISHGDEGIQVSVICPQYVATPMLGYEEGDDFRDYPGVLGPDIEPGGLDLIPLHRNPRPIICIANSVAVNLYQPFFATQQLASSRLQHHLA